MWEWERELERLSSCPRSLPWFGPSGVSFIPAAPNQRWRAQRRSRPAAAPWAPLAPTLAGRVLTAASTAARSIGSGRSRAVYTAHHGVNKSVQNLPALRKALSAINDSYLNVQQDILETFIDRGQLRRLAEPTITPTGKRIPGLRLDHPRQLAVMHALVRFAHVAAGNSFTTAEITLTSSRRSDAPPSAIRLPRSATISPSCEPALVANLPGSRRYQLLPQGYSICLVFLKLFERVYAPLTAGLLSPLSADAKVPDHKRSQLDRLYHRVIDDLDALVEAVGLKAA